MSASGARSDDNTGSSESQEHQDPQGHVSNPLRGVRTHSHWDLKFDDFVEWARDQELHEDFCEKWKSKLWTFTRWIKGWLKEGIKADEAFRMCTKSLTKSLTNRGLAHSEITNAWVEFGVSPEEAYAEFTNAWKKIRYRPGENPITQALLKAERHPVKAPKKDGESRPTPAYDRFISLVGWLQFTMGAKPIYLPVRKIAEALKTDIRMVSLWRQMAVDEGFLEIVAAHIYKPGGRGKATEFRVTDGFASWFKEHMAKRLT